MASNTAIDAVKPSTNEEPRTALLRATLSMLDIEVPNAIEPTIRPTPLLLTSLDPQEADQLASEIASKFPNQNILSDLHDTFTIHPQSSISWVFDTATSRPSSDNEHTKLDVIVCSEACPARSLIAIFSVQDFQESLLQARKSLSFPFRPSFGSELLYGEVVTSTQTVLDK